MIENNRIKGNRKEGLKNSHRVSVLKCIELSNGSVLCIIVELQKAILTPKARVHLCKLMVQCYIAEI